MFGLVSISSLMLFAAAVGPEVAEMADGRFHVRIVFDDTSPRGNAMAQMALMQAAAKFCQGKGQPVSEGSLNLNNADPIRGKRKALELSETYACVSNAR